MKKNELPKEVDDLLKKEINFIPKKWGDDSGTAKVGLETINEQYFENLGQIVEDTKDLRDLNLDFRIFGSHFCLRATDDMKIYIAEQLNPLYPGRTLIVIFYNYKLQKTQVLTADRPNCFQITMSLPDVLAEIFKRGIG